MTVEGENDDISGVGQTEASTPLGTNLPADMVRIHCSESQVILVFVQRLRFVSEFAADAFRVFTHPIATACLL